MTILHSGAPPDGRSARLQPRHHGGRSARLQPRPRHDVVAGLKPGAAARGFSRAITAVRRTNSIDVDQDSICGDQTAVGGGR